MEEKIKDDVMGSDKEYEQYLKEWKELKLTATQARNAEKELATALHESVRYGADKDSMESILKLWQEQYEKANEFERQLLKKGDPDFVQDFATKQKANVEKSMYMVGEKTKEYNQEFKEGKISTGKLLGDKIKQLNSQIARIFSNVQKNLFEKLDKAFSNIKEETYAKLDQKRLDGWIKAMDAMDRYDNTMLDRLQEIDEKKENKIQDLIDNATKQKENNVDKFNKRVEEIKNNIPSRTERFFAGIKTSLSALFNKPFENLLSAENVAKNAKSNFEKAKNDLVKADKNVDLKRKSQIGFVKLWTKAKMAMEDFTGKLLKLKVKMAEKDLEKIKDPKVTDLKEKIASYSKDNNVTRAEAKSSLLKEQRTAENKDVKADIDAGKER